MNLFEDLLEKDGRLVYKIKGRSMKPMLRENRDLVIVEVPSARLQKDDVALYKRGEQYVLHRVIAVGDGFYRIRGDNTYSLEHVSDEQILGVLTGFTRRGRNHAVTESGYRFYVRFWNFIYPLRFVWFHIKRGLKAVAEKLGIAPFLKKLLRRG